MQGKEDLNNLEYYKEKGLKSVQSSNEDVAYHEKYIIELENDIRLLKNRIGELEKVIYLMENSRSWKITSIARKLGINLRLIKRILVALPITIERKGGVFNLSKLCISKLRNGGVRDLYNSVNKLIMQSEIETPSCQKTENMEFLSNVTKKASNIFEKRILIIAEMGIPQCTKYRVIQKKELFEQLGIKCEIVSWKDANKAKSLISLSSYVIFYRVYYENDVITLINECKRLNIPTFWEIDDLMFNRTILEENRTVQSLPIHVRDNLYKDAELFKKAMLACNYAITSTSKLASEMKAVGMKDVFIIENAIDEETLNIANEILINRCVVDDKIRIVYGSGTTAHNIDFQEVAPSLAKILREYDNVVFRLIGMLELPSYFSELKDKIERIEFCSYPEYLRLLSECDISIAPLENSITNHAKSNIKYLEASILKIPSICSPLQSFTDVVIHNKNGLLANSDKEWYECFIKLINSRDLRKCLAEQAYTDVNKGYSYQYIAKKLLHLLPECNNHLKKRLLSFNIFYYPRSFGGATIVAEEINNLMKENDFEVYVVTSLPVSMSLSPYSIVRYEHNGVTVFGIAIPDTDMGVYTNARVAEIVEKIIELVSPDIAHFHAIQGLGVDIVELCHKKRIKTAVTLHDAWWICSQQFMIKPDGKFCHQYTLNKSECIKCAGNGSKYAIRYNRLYSILENVDYLLAPSSYSQELYYSYIGRKPILNKNGINYPQCLEYKSISRTIRFGYVGGNGFMKGFPLISKAFREYKFSNAKLVVVDNALNLGLRTYIDKDFNGIENYEIVPAYTQDTLDDFFDSIDILLFPTQCKESFGLTIREAIVRNVWVISTDCGGPIDDIIEDVNGNIIPLDSDYKQLANTIQRVIERYQEKYCEREISLEKSHIFSFRNQVDQLIEIFRE
ncbi:MULTISPECIES: glycosyltransferase [Glaesserella]|uniref:Glycosyl transferase n=1 Tax=Glaesserella australis TaxID=2094024 RepID=A0A328C0Z4_9PAST|nr:MULTISPECIES: glycosyltransferase [Glaesserella]AUI67103.1 glycosyl transferase [Glaesserella sp. 15-184]RAL18154.1 glycosyl transferase [Glaesserella australis]